MRIKNNLPDFSAEGILWQKGFKFVAGVDEVGRGAWAGPLVAGAVVFALEFRIENLECRIDDSKRLSETQRELAAAWIKENALAWSVGEVNVPTINRVGIGKATAIAMRRAINNIHNSKFHIQYLLIDAFYIPYVNGVRRKNQLAIIDGDQKSFSIAAASIIAKVYRDSLMRSLSKQFNFKKYGWASGKGYGTRAHQKAIKRHGITKMHRRKFVESWINRVTT